MISSKRLVAMARRWKKLAGIGRSRRRISMSKPDIVDSRCCNKGAAPTKDHFVIYTSDGRRFVVPLAFHNSPIFQELFNMSEDEYGLPRDGPIIIPCDAAVMEYIISLLPRAMPKEVERALIMSMSTNRCSSVVPCNLLLPQANPRIPLQGY